MSAVLSAIAAHRTAYATYSIAVQADASDSPIVLTTGKAEREAVSDTLDIALVEAVAEFLKGRASA